MRILVRVLLDEKSNRLIPFDHQYALASYLYKIIGKENPSYFIRLHSSKTYKFFTFSYLMAEKRKLTDEGIEIIGDKVYFFVSSPSTTFIQTIVDGMLSNPSINIRGVKGVIAEIKVLKKPRFRSKMRFRTVSPIIIRKPLKVDGKLKSKDLYPTDEEFNFRLVENLKKKFSMFSGKDVVEKEFNVKFIKFKPKRHRIMQTYHRCVLGEFFVEGDKELMEFGYDCGFGEKNSMGFGMVKEWNKQEK